MDALVAAMGRTRVLEGALCNPDAPLSDKIAELVTLIASVERYNLTPEEAIWLGSRPVLRSLLAEDDAVLAGAVRTWFECMYRELALRALAAQAPESRAGSSDLIWPLNGGPP